jgi:23S rRNA (adenine2503-C2)-methyltransferase
MQSILGLNLEELGKVLEDWGQPRFRAGQIFSWIYKKRVADFDAMSDLPQELRRLLKDNFRLFVLKPVKALKSRDGTEKFVFGLDDGNFIETVSIPAQKRVTVCLSTQVGCKFGCFFCASGVMGFKRNLTSAEIIGQVVYLNNDSADKKITHLVFMGIGEPLDNYDNVMKAIRIINSPQGLNIGARRITVSTCGIIPAIKKLAGEGLQIELSVSLHAPDDKTRTALMPANKAYSLKDLIVACREYIERTNRQITFEYILVKGVNSDLPKAVKLSTILKGLNCKVNLIPSNYVPDRKIEPPARKEILLFRDSLLRQGINVTLRRPRGDDINAACGQLRLGYEKK